MTALFLVISISSMVLQNCLYTSFSKSAPRTKNEIYFFNVFSYGVCILCYSVLAIIQHSLSLFTVITGMIFGFLTLNSVANRMKALTIGPMNITLLITTSSMIIPTMSGVFFNEGFSPMKLCGVAVLLFFVYLALGTGNGKKFNKLWLFHTMLAFVCQGLIGVMQKVHQTSQYKNESAGFLLVAFIFSFVYSLIFLSKDVKNIKMENKFKIFSLVCGLFVFAMNFLNLTLSGMLPSQLMFPLVNGSSIIINIVVSVLFFKETLSRKQLIGVCGGIACLIAICLLP